MVTKEEIIQRNERMLQVLQGLTPHERRKHFNMGNFGSRTECGTVCCIAGYCGRNQWFRKRGISLRFRSRRARNAEFIVNGVDWGTVGNDGIKRPLDDFFGEGASRELFFNFELKTFGAAIRAIKDRIKRLKAA